MALIDCGFVGVVLLCPRCGERSDVQVFISARLVVTADESQLRPVMKSNPVDHRCGQIRMEDPADAGADDDPDQPALDFAQLAAGEGAR